jgi:hypothetical protein
MAPGSSLNHHEPERLMLGAQMGTSAMDSRAVFENSACLQAAALSIHRRIKRASAECVLASLQTNDLLHASVHIFVTEPKCGHLLLLLRHSKRRGDQDIVAI